jgi:hypothetical protein
MSDKAAVKITQQHRAYKYRAKSNSSMRCRATRPQAAALQTEDSRMKSCNRPVWQAWFF